MARAEFQVVSSSQVEDKKLNAPGSQMCLAVQESSPTRATVRCSDDLSQDTSPFASPVSWGRSNLKDFGASKSLPCPITLESLAKSCSFSARQLSFQDWCFNAVNEPNKGNTADHGHPSPPSSDVDLRPPAKPSPRRLMGGYELPHISSTESLSFGADIDSASLDVDDFLSCKEVLSSSVEYGPPSSKRRRSCYAF